MKHTLTKRALSLLLAILLVVGLLPATAQAESSTGPQLAEGTYASWTDRLASSDYDHFRDWLSANKLMDPSSYATQLENGDYVYLLRQYTGTADFTYDDDPETAAMTAVEKTIAASGNDDLDTVTDYASAIYSAWLMDQLDVFYLTGEVQVGEERVYDLEYNAGAGTVSYTQNFYFYLTKADGSFDIRAQEYPSADAIRTAASSWELRFLSFFHSNTVSNRTRYEALLAVHQYLIEHNEYNTSADLSAIGHDCRTIIGGFKGSTGTDGLVCEGYARTFAMCAAELGYPVTLVTGLANGEPHMWVNIQMDDGNWYAADPTWNDPVGGNAGAVSGLENTKYFLVGSNTVIDGVTFSQSHVATNAVTGDGLALTNGPELATDSYTVKPGDISETAIYINGQNVKDIDEADDTITWNEETKTLTLNNASILAADGTHKGSGIYVVGSDTVVLELMGNSTVEGMYDGSDGVFSSAAISTVADLIIRGDGTLTATDLLSEYTAKKSAGIFVGGNLTVENGTVYTKSDGTSGHCNGLVCGDYDTNAILSVAGGIVNATGQQNGIFTEGEVRISDGSVYAASLGDSDYGIYVHSLALSGPGSLVISGGTLTTYGNNGAFFGLMSLSGYDFYRWKDTADGEFQYSVLNSGAAQNAVYLHIEPSPYVISQPGEDNQFSDQVQYRGDGEWTDLPEDIVANYQWHHVSNTFITDQNIFQASEVMTYDSQSGLWTVPSMTTSPMYFAAVAGDMITLNVQADGASILYIATATSMFTEISPGIYTYTVAETDIDAASGMFMMMSLSDAEIKLSITTSSLQKVETASDTPYLFASDTAGTYIGRVTLSEDGEAFAVLETDFFDYTYTGWKNVYGDGGVVLGTQYLYRHEVQYTGWTEIDGEWYYLDPTTGYRAESLTRVPYPTASINGITYSPNMEDVKYANDKGTLFKDALTAPFIFAEDGTFQGGYTGFITDGETTRWASNGCVVFHIGLVENEDEYYYFLGDTSNGGNILATGDVYVSRNTTDLAVTTGGIYTFGTDGKLCQYNGITDVNGVLRYYENASLMIGNGLTKVGKETFSVTLNDYGSSKLETIKALRNQLNLSLKAAKDLVDNAPSLLGTEFTAEKAQEICDAMAEVGASVTVTQSSQFQYIYVTSDGELIVDAEYYIPANDLGIVSGNYSFDANGYLTDPMFTAKTGVYYENGAWYYYEDGKIGYNKGLIYVDTVWHGETGDADYSGYIYVRSSGKLATGTYWITNVENDNSGLFIAGQRVKFSDLGIADAPKHGIVDVDGTLYYYQYNAIAHGAGLIEVDGGWIYVRSNGTLATGQYWVTNTNGSMEAGYYEFGTDGYLTVSDKADGVVAESGKLYYYLDGRKQYGLGLVQLDDGTYIYVRTGGELAVSTYWITNHNGLLPEGLYEFNSDGILSDI